MSRKLLAPVLLTPEAYGRITCMTKRQKAAKQSDKAKARTDHPNIGDGEGKTGRLKNYWLTIGVPVLIVALGAWLTPLPGYIIHVFSSHSSSSGAFVRPVTAAVQTKFGPCGRAWVVDRSEERRVG